MNTVTVQSGETIQLGYQYDNKATQVVFPSEIISPFITTYGSGGTFEIWFRRSGETVGQVLDSSRYTQTSTAVTWLLTEEDMEVPGNAQVQLRYLKDEHEVMSEVFSAYINDSVDIE